jgi:hypothetical protein
VGRAAKSYRISILIRLIATTVHRIIPDPHDLASLRALGLACLVIIDLDSDSNESGLTDDLCEPLVSDTTWETRLLDIRRSGRRSRHFAER